MAPTLWMQMHTGPKEHTASRQWATHTTRYPKRIGQTYSMLCLPSWKDEEDKQAIVKEFYGSLKFTWSPSTADKVVNSNDTVSVDWGIVNKRQKQMLRMYLHSF